jgi:hypothetical protein
MVKYLSFHNSSKFALRNKFFKCKMARSHTMCDTTLVSLKNQTQNWVPNWDPNWAQNWVPNWVPNWAPNWVLDFHPLCGMCKVWNNKRGRRAVCACTWFSQLLCGDLEAGESFWVCVESLVWQHMS